MEEVGRLWRDAGVLRGSRDGVGTPRAGEGARDPREHPGKCPALAPVAPVASLGAPAVGPGPAHLGPGSPQVNAFCGHQRQESTDAFTESGVRARGD